MHFVKPLEYRLFVKKQQAHLLMECLKETRIIYNEMLESVKSQYEEKGIFPSKYDLETAFKGQGEHVPATTVQMLAYRLSKSLKPFLAAKQNNIPGIGFHCGELVQKSLSVRTHVCPFCGYVADRDVNAAKNILQAGARPSGAKHSDGGVSLRSPQL